MADPLSALNELCDVAHGAKDRESRRALLRRITDVFLEEPGSYTEQQRCLFGDIMEKLAYDLEMQVREELARRIAAEADAPNGLVCRLANDEIYVARPVLERSPALTEDDLIAVSQNCSQDHLLAITKRSDISARLSAVLEGLGKDYVVEGLLGNETAEIDAETVKNVADRAIKSEPLQLALIDRKDVPREIVIGLLEHVSEKIRDLILDRMTDTDIEYLDNIIGTMRESIEESPETSAEAYIKDLERRGRLDEDALVEMATEKKPMEFLLGLAALLKIEEKAVQRVVTDKSGQALLIACRAAGFSTATFKTLALSPLTGVASQLNEIVHLIRTYEKLSIPEAQRTMRYWQTRDGSNQSGTESKSNETQRSKKDELHSAQQVALA